MLMGKVTASAMGKKRPGFAFGTDIFIAAGTAIYDALAAKMANIKRLEISCVINLLMRANRQPLISGIVTAKRSGNQPAEKNDFNFLLCTKKSLCIYSLGLFF